MSNSGCRIYSNIKRAESNLVNLFKDIPVANLADNMGRIACVDSGIKPMNSSKLLGVAFTVKAPAGDNLLFHKALDMAMPGDIIVVSADGYTNRSLCGEIMFTYAISRGISGCIIDGAIRDVEATSKFEEFPVYAKGVQPNGPYKNGPGEINTPVSVGGIVIYPGDILVGDADGVLAIRPSEAREIYNKVLATMEVEKKSFEDIGNGCFDRKWVDKKLEDIGCSIISKCWDEE